MAPVVESAAAGLLPLKCLRSSVRNCIEKHSVLYDINWQWSGGVSTMRQEPGNWLRIKKAKNKLQGNFKVPEKQVKELKLM